MSPPQPWQHQFNQLSAGEKIQLCVFSFFSAFPSEFHPAHDYKTLQTSWHTLSKCLLLLERKLVMGSCDCSSGQQSGAVRRQIKYWILDTVKRLLYTTKKTTATALWSSKAIKRPGPKMQSKHVAPTESSSPHDGPHLSQRRFCVGGCSLASSRTSWASCEASFPLSLINMITTVSRLGWKNVEEVSDLQRLSAREIVNLVISDLGCNFWCVSVMQLSTFHLNPTELF